MSNGNLNQDEIRLAEYLVANLRDKTSGRSESECVRNYPRDVYFIGNLRPSLDELSDQTQPGHLRELMVKLAPMAFGAEFLVRPERETVEVDVTLNWACYYRVFPSFSQQCEHQRQDVATGRTTGAKTDVAAQNQANEKTGSPAQDDETIATEQERENQTAEADSPEIADSARDRRRARTPQDSLFLRFRKISCQVNGLIVVNIDQGGFWAVDSSNLQAFLDQEMARAQQIALTDPDRVQTDGNPYAKIRVPVTALASETVYQEFLQSLHGAVIPEWHWQIRAEIWATMSTDPAERVMAVEFVNTSPMLADSPNTEAFLFDTVASFAFAGREVRPFEVDLVPRGFRFDRYVWGRGINCAVERENNEIPGFQFVTTHTPVYRQMRFATHTVPPARFADLAQNPLPILNSILQSMEDYRQEWGQELQRYISNNSGWEIQHGAEFDRDRLKFEEEIEWFRRGCELIRLNPDVQLAFQLTNETFNRGPKTEWRLFQIVFLVSQIPGIVALADPEGSASGIGDRERVDIIYFPTGGGKTEAYLATIIFHCFWDRLRGKACGVTAWTRFPLRLLTLQQTQRVADVIGMAEIVRREQSDSRLAGSGVDGFAVGYFVGQGGSPNEIVNPQGNPRASAEIQVIWSKVNDPDARQNWKRVVRCPSCRASVQIEFDPTSTELIHRCSEPTCRFPQRKIPVYIVDNEIYRYLPCVIVGTIDKLAGLGNQRKFALLFGQADGRCSIHGYYKGRCCQKDCSDLKRLQPTLPSGLSGPTLFVQDELHLLKEGLGTFDAHYETFTQQLQQEFGQTQPLKVIASSATIEAFERQVNQLYGRSPTLARVFPGLGPTLGRSFYAETLPHPQRLYVGVIPHNKTIFNSILELLDFYHREIQALQRLATGSPNPYGGAFMPGSPDWEQLLDVYATSLTYFLANRELNSIRTDIEGDVIPHLLRDGLLPVEISELTGSTSTDDVSRILDRLERAAPPNSSPDAVLATSMVSHGVDVDRLNAMIFYGMPRQNAEYIQASSRVGRSHVGLVFTCLHPVRERDQSHYAYFLKFHEFLGQLVEPVAINRWSKFSINRTLPGLFMAVLLQLVANRSGEGNPNRYYMLDFVRGKISDGSLRPEDFISLLEQAYGVQTPTTPGEIVFRDEIHLRVRQYLDWILSPAAGLRFVSDVLIPKPMRSLRDVDEAIPIELDSLGTQWTGRAGGQ
ncbi:helicase-related protein [Syntrophobacter fumaroxidans]|nr:helicase-related protein [Syntrophobacter fumaroxidans]